MLKSELHIGQRVYVPSHSHGFAYNRSTIEKTGTVVRIYQPHESCYEVGVEFDEEIDGGHNCGGKARNGHGYMGHANELEEYFENIEVPNTIAMPFDNLMSIGGDAS